MWLACSLAAAVWIFLASERTVSVAGHEAEIRPDFSGQVMLRTGPVLPDLRVDSGRTFGAEVLLGKTEAPSTEALIERYALIASQPDGPADKVASSVRWMLLSSTVNGLLVGAAPVAVWWLIGGRHRVELFRQLRSRRGIAVVVALTLVASAAWVVRAPDEKTLSGDDDWVPLQEFLGSAITLPEEAPDVEVLSTVTTAQTRRLIESAVDTYRISREFYADLAERASEVELRTPADDETVVTLVSDRHDNIGMDAVARALADEAGATAVFDAGDDTSTGSEWEAFSLDSLVSAFSDLDGRWVATGNHDQGAFVGDYLDDRGWTVLEGEVVDGPGGGRLLGVGDPRSSGLGNWRDETGLPFGEVVERVADAACEAHDDGERVNTILVHDENLGDEALARGCVDLVLAGHTHVVAGPGRRVGENGEAGYTFTTGTTGGAAYAIAIGSKLRRAATVTFVTYDADGVPAGLQGVTVETNGVFQVGAYVELTY